MLYTEPLSCVVPGVSLRLPSTSHLSPLETSTGTTWTVCTGWDIWLSPSLARTVWCYGNRLKKGRSLRRELLPLCCTGSDENIK